MTNDTPETGTSIILAPGTSLESLLSIDKGLDPVLDQIERDARAEVSDLTTLKGRKAVASLAFKVSKSKSALDAAGKAMNAEARKKIDVVDAQRRAARERLDTLRDEIRDPLTAWETADERRIADHELALNAFDLNQTNAMSRLPDIQEAIDRAKGEMLRDWEEFNDRAQAMSVTAFAKFESDLEAAKIREQEKAELARLREEAEAHEREKEQRRKEDEDRQRKEAQERIRIAQEKEERLEVIRVHEEYKRNIEAKAERLEAERIAQEEAKRIAAEKAKADELAAAQAEKERHERYSREADERQRAALQAERDRIAKAKDDEDKARAKREADKKHVFRIRGEITKALQSIEGQRMEDIAQAIIDGKIPHVTATI
jgi:hypothetical protein